MGVLTPRVFAAFFFPLALSWVLMSAESPISLAILGRGADAQVMAAGLLMVVGLSMFIESPVIDLLATATTLGRGSAEIRALERYSILMIGAVTAVHALVAFTPLYDLIVYGLVNAPREVGEASRVPFMCMTPWSGFIGWRRWRQGVMIRAGFTRAITAGTLVRVATLIATGGALASLRVGSGLMIVALALVASVVAEAAFIHFASRRAMAELSREPGADIPWVKLFKFHLPLTASTAVMLTGGPIVAGALARLPEPVLHMAAWSVAGAVAFLFRTVTYALPEVVIALGQDEANVPALKRYCLATGGLMAALMIALHVTRGDAALFRSFLNAPVDVADRAREAFFWASALPLLGGMLGYMKGRLTGAHQTFARLVAIVAGLTAMATVLHLGVQYQWPAMVVAPLALAASQGIELLTQWLHWRRHLLAREALT